ncbi:cupin domain-containing protein [Fundicoccus sp. Sow4_D5]|uniref:cupin domain-containing protein n=1 Tax=Fundicoccus sp. Sow4_D5 TaxID=3438782 RepID=UPI003F8F1863
MSLDLRDYGKDPFVINIEAATLQNDTFRTALWTGSQLQVTLMSIPVGGDIGGEIHTKEDQFLRLEQGQGRVVMGTSEEDITFEKDVADDDVILIPKGIFHNVINTGDQPMKLYSIYGPAHHAHGTVHETQAIAEAEEEEHHHH